MPDSLNRNELYKLLELLQIFHLQYYCDISHIETEINNVLDKLEFKGE